VIYALTASFGLQPLPAAWPGGGVIAIMIYLCVGPTAICIALWNFGTARLGVTVAMVILNSAPVFAVLLGVALGAKPTALQLAGGAVTLAGVLWLQFGARRPTSRASVDAIGERR
jgi:drug/metabolite transporter (DMT)-like permease